MLANLDNRLVVMVVDPPNETIMLEARTSGMCRWVDAPLVVGLKLEDDSFVDEAQESLFEGYSGSEEPNGSPLSLGRDLWGGIGEGLGVHVTVMRGGLEVKVVKASSVVEGAASCSGVPRCFSASWGGDM